MSPPPTAVAHPVRTITAVCLGLALAVVVPSALFSAGLPWVGFILFVLLVLLWPVLALGAWALRRGDR